MECDNCSAKQNKSNIFKRCSGCKSVSYCSSTNTNCQTNAWPKHKTKCRQIQRDKANLEAKAEETAKAEKAEKKMPVKQTKKVLELLQNGKKRTSPEIFLLIQPLEKIAMQHGMQDHFNPTLMSLGVVERVQDPTNNELRLCELLEKDEIVAELQETSEIIVAELLEKCKVACNGTARSVSKCGNCSKTHKKLRLCERCVCIKYCSTECQKAHKAAHQDLCDSQAAVIQHNKANGIDVGSDNMRLISNWFASVPDLFNAVACLAWQNRANDPLFKVIGTNGGDPPAEVQMILRETWGDPRLGVSENLVPRFDDPSFDCNFKFLAMVTPKPNELVKTATCRFIYPRTPDMMDAWVVTKLAELGNCSYLRTPVRTKTKKQKPNEPCGCGSKKKYKKCCRKAHVAAESHR